MIMISKETCHGEFILDSLDGPKVITRVHKRWKKEAEGRSQGNILKSYTVDVEDGKRDPEPRNAGSL